MFWLLPIAAIGTGIYFVTRRGAKKPVKVEPKPVKVEPKPGEVESLPFTVKTVGDASFINITDAFGTYGWATKTALETGARSDANAGDVLRILGRSVPGVGKTISGVKFSEIDEPNDEYWDDIIKISSSFTWGEAMVAAESFLQSKGLG